MSKKMKERMKGNIKMIPQASARIKYKRLMSQAQIGPTTMLIQPENAAAIGLEYQITLLSFTKKGNVHFTALEYDQETNTHNTRAVGSSQKVKLAFNHGS